MIGLSLSFCIKDILYGRIREEDVHLIIAGTCARTDADFEHMIGVNYAGDYWYLDPQRGLRIARRLWREGKIFQPRVYGGEAPNIASGHWLLLTTQPSLPLTGAHHV
jgi:hypothetical protein